MTEELPAAGETFTPLQRPRTVESPGTVSVPEAVERWKVSERTLRRRLMGGEIAGAHKVPGAKGEEWRIPAAALDSLGYERTDAGAPDEPATVAPAPEVSELLHELRADREAWRTLAADTRRELMAAESDRRAAEVARLEVVAEAARLEERVAAVERERDRLAEELEEARKRRRWFRSRG